jgi:hypothetical protein
MRTSALIRASALACALAVVLPAAAKAHPITFADITIASGTIGQTSFTNALITISAFADTSNIAPIVGGDGFSLDNASASITIGSLGTFTFVTGTRFFQNFGLPGFSRASTSGFDLINGPAGEPAFSSWAMLTSIGPITGFGGVLQWSAGGPLPAVVTSGGTLVLSDGAADITFSARVSAPEPSTILLIATALLGLGRFMRRQPAKVDRQPRRDRPDLWPRPDGYRHPAELKRARRSPDDAAPAPGDLRSST